MMAQWQRVWFLSVTHDVCSFRCAQSGTTALMWAALEGQLEMVKLLLARKADTEARCTVTTGERGGVRWG